jgi:hypothetical protein
MTSKHSRRRAHCVEHRILPQVLARGHMEHGSGDPEAYHCSQREYRAHALDLLGVCQIPADDVGLGLGRARPGPFAPRRARQDRARSHRRRRSQASRSLRQQDALRVGQGGIRQRTRGNGGNLRTPATRRRRSLTSSTSPRANGPVRRVEGRNAADTGNGLRGKGKLPATGVF